MSANRLVAVGSIVTLLILGTAYFLWGRDDAVRLGTEIERDSNRQVVRAQRHSAVPGVRPELSWMYERGLASRRIAGHVTIDGRPAVDVEVSLRSEAMMHSELPPTTRRSDAEGRFDFGEWPVTQYAVVAGGDQYALAVAKVDLVDPLVDSHEVSLKLKACPREGFGTVSSLYGEEISGATLTVTARMPPAVFFDVTSQPVELDGSFRLCLSSARTDFRIDAPGFAQASVHEMPGRPMPKGGWRIQLFPAGAISGHYRDSQGRGIAGGRMALFRKSIGHHLSYLQHVISEADGSFAFAAVGPGKYEVAVDHSDYMLEMDWPTVSLAPGEEKTGIVVTGGSCRKIAGTILSEDGSPVAGALVSSARSQTDGSFVVPCERFEEFELDVAKYQVLSALVPAGSEDLIDLVVRVASPHSLSGRVVAEGEPVANATITLRSKAEGTMSTSERTRSSDAGEYRFPSVTPGAYSLEASTADGASDELSVQMSDSDLERDLIIEAGTQVSGTVSTEDGVPLSGIAVQFTSTSGKRSSVITADGRFQTAVSGRESHEVVLRRQYSEHYAPPEDAPWPTIQAGAGEVTLDLRIAGISHRLSGQVVYENNNPVPNAKVYVVPTGRDQLTDDKGFFLFENLPASTFEVYARDLAGLKANAKSIVATEGVAEDVKVVIERGATIVGTITDGTAACRIKLLGKEYRIARGASFSFDDLPPGNYAMEAQCDEAVAAKRISVGAGGRVDVSLELETGISVDGIVKEFSSGEPMAKLECRAGMAEAKTDASGHFQLRQVAPLATEIRCSRYESPIAFGQGALSAAGGAHQKIELWGFTSPNDFETRIQEGGRLGAELAVEKGQLLFTKVDPAGECEQLGIQDGDQLWSVAGIAVRGIEKVVELYLQSLPEGGSVELEIRRGDEQMSLTLGAQGD